MLWLQMPLLPSDAIDAFCRQSFWICIALSLSTFGLSTFRPLPLAIDVSTFRFGRAMASDSIYHGDDDDDGNAEDDGYDYDDDSDDDDYDNDADDCDDRR